MIFKGVLMFIFQAARAQWQCQTKARSP